MVCRKSPPGSPESLWYEALGGLKRAQSGRDESAFNRHLLDLLTLKEQFPDLFPDNPLVLLLNRPFVPEQLASLPVHARFYALQQILLADLLSLSDPTPPLNFLMSRSFWKGLDTKEREPFRYLLLIQLLLRAESLVGIPCGSEKLPSGLEAWRLFLRGENEEALARYREDLKAIRKSNRNDAAYFTGIEGLFYLLALLRKGEYALHPEIESLVSDLETIQPYNPFLPAYRLLLALVDARENRLKSARARLEAAAPPHKHPDSITLLFRGLAAYWLDGQPAPSLIPDLKAAQEKAAAAGYLWLDKQYTALLAVCDEAESNPERVPASPSLVEMIPVEEQWQRALKALDLRPEMAAPAVSPEPSARLAWIIDFGPHIARPTLIPKVQSINRQGQWSKGRRISLDRLRRTEDLPFLLKQDLDAVQCIVGASYGEAPSLSCAPPETLLALVGHPHLFLAKSSGVPVEILKGEAEIQVDQRGDFLHVRFFPWPAPGPLTLIRESPTRLRVYPIGERHRRVAAAIGPEGLRVPIQGKDRLFASLGNISAFMPVHSSIDGQSADFDERAPDSRIHLQLLPYGSGIRLAMLVRPLHPEGPYCQPGEGPKILLTRTGGRSSLTRRDLEQEEANASRIEELCPTLAALPDTEREWRLPEPEESLSLLLELQELPEEVVIEWPEGQRLTVSPPAEPGQFLLTVRDRNNWFELDGSLRLNDTLILKLRTLLDLAGKTESRFVPLGHGHFLTLSQELRRMLDELAILAELRKNSIRIHPLRALALEDFTGEAGSLDVDTAWQQRKQRLEEANRYEAPVPETLKASLRDYQLTGFKWLARLAHWGVGACLADDMGLGKTIQSLALILHRATDGPSLVVAPTSVCANWQEEAARFAPALRVISFGGRNRQESLAQLAPFDLVVCSYGLLQQEADLLASIHWQTIVLDEAQAIKNFIAKRSRAAMKLNGGFKFVTTGTPLENHLGELWNLFEFINPGLLGSLNHFTRHFIIPIERHKDQEVRNSLKKLIAPFILRRLKSQVLTELPGRTEIVLQVEMNEEEAALYAALRQNALAALVRSDSAPGRHSFRILAEIMKLRRACCNPRLILPESEIKSSKLDMFGKLVSELRDNGHRALVFSQFVDHLSLIREYLDRKQIDYRYLDGATSTKERQRQVHRFQNGEGDLFLISLRAGGLGLNLTAADYVIHLDPWWNPAVEDQAANRAHRIGQQRPVTVYRLVTKGSIEEKIVRLHEEKRELADSLLEGTDLGHSISPDELLRLLKEV